MQLLKNQTKYKILIETKTSQFQSQKTKEKSIVGAPVDTFLIRWSDQGKEEAKVKS